MNISNAIKKGFSLSFEIFPPKTSEGEKKLWQELEILSGYNPSFISVTYGAGGSTREKTLDIALEIKNRFSITPLVHFTCVGSSRDEIKSYINTVKGKGISDIMALRGDPPRGEKYFKPVKNGFRYANELVEFIKSLNNFSIAVAGYPEGHPEAPDLDTDIENLKKKVDAGADFIITQLYFDNEYFYEYMNKIKQIGIKIPVIPGILPVTSLKQVKKLTELSGATIPAKLINQLNKCEYDDAMCEPGIEFSIQQCKELLDWGVQGFHLYTINRSFAVSRVIDALGIK